ncbi:MAG: ribonuclease III domain-containing protein, partial [Peptostreptococcaceae bacterium]|nr:ribonuclease III domain-containing protein [Peptostreptococcaceae bacterium]
MNSFEKLERQIDYAFKDKELLKTALTHTSYANEHRMNKNSKSRTKNNERLEFLGDSVLNLIITTHLFKALGRVSEGEMSRIRSTIVCEKSLRDAAEGFDLKNYLLLGKGEEQTGGRNRDSIIADAME